MFVAHLFLSPIVLANLSYYCQSIDVVITNDIVDIVEEIRVMCLIKIPFVRLFFRLACCMV